MDRKVGSLMSDYQLRINSSIDIWSEIDLLTHCSNGNKCYYFCRHISDKLSSWLSQSNLNKWNVLTHLLIKMYVYASLIQQDVNFTQTAQRSGLIDHLRSGDHILRFYCSLRYNCFPLLSTSIYCWFEACLASLVRRLPASQTKPILFCTATEHLKEACITEWAWASMGHRHCIYRIEHTKTDR